MEFRLLFRPIFMKTVLLLIALISVYAQKLEVKVVRMPGECKLKSKNGNMLSMHYTGTLAANGRKFDSSRDHGTPFKFQIGTGQVIKGWDQGLLDMCVGEVRKLTVPPELGYGDRGAGKVIPGGATLVFEVELISIAEPDDESKVKAKPADEPQTTAKIHKVHTERNIFKQIDQDNDDILSKEEVRAFVSRQNAASEGSKRKQRIESIGRNEDAVLEDIFKREDKNNDGLISHNEFSGPKDDYGHDEL